MSSALGRVRRLVSWHRRSIAALLAAAAAVTVLAAARPPAAATVTVLAAARSLDGGHTLSTEDVREVALAADTAPAGVLVPGDGVMGRVLAGPVREGEPLTDVGLVGPSLLGALEEDGLVGVPLRLADPQAVALLSPGDLVDVLAAQPAEVGVADTAHDFADVVASRVRVLTVPRADPGTPLLGGGVEEGALVVLAAPPDTAAALAGAEAAARLSVVLRAG
ncbi:MAG: Flp pilus assembly protein CpaB [Actinomycetes bacterium]